VLSNDLSASVPLWGTADVLVTGCSALIVPNEIVLQETSGCQRKSHCGGGDCAVATVHCIGKVVARSGLAVLANECGADFVAALFRSAAFGTMVSIMSGGAATLVIVVLVAMFAPVVRNYTLTLSEAAASPAQD
jgi:hypothetical protein